MNNNTIFQSFDNITFSDLWSTSNSFISDFKNSGLPQTYSNASNPDATQYYVSDEDLGLIWTLLIGRFADSTIKPYNTFGAFKIRFFSKVWQYAPGWKKELDIQNELRSMSLSDGSVLFEGGRAIYNTALNPGTGPSTQDTEELNFVNSQNVTKYKKSKIEGITMLQELLSLDVTEKFLRRFDDFFKTIIYSGRDLTYVTEGDI